MNRRTPEEIEAFNKAVAKALGNSKAGKSMVELEEALGGPEQVDRTHLRRALLANGAESLGNTRAARWFSEKAIAKYGRAALNPQAD
jgi:hypothetical protein